MVGEGDTITVFGEERQRAYDRVHLSDFFSGRGADDLYLCSAEFYSDAGVELKLGQRIDRIDTAEKVVRTACGKSTPYDELILATGSDVFIPPIPGADLPGCFPYRTLDDLAAIRDFASGKKTGLVVGGGLLGLEAANALRTLGLKTHVVELAPRLMPLQVDVQGGLLLKSLCEGLGISVHVNRKTQAITSEAGQLKLAFAGGGSLDVGLVVFSAGIRARDDLARSSGLTLGERGGIAIDDFGRTSAEHVFAVGECASHRGRTYGLVGPGYQMAEVVAAGLLGQDTDGFHGADMSTKLKLLGVDVASFGDAHGETEGALSYSFIDEPAGVYKKIVVDADKTQIIGGVLVGDASDYSSLSMAAKEGLPLPEQPALLIAPQGDGTAPMMGTEGLPDTAMICSCNNIDKGAIRSAIQGGCDSVKALQSETSAGAGCGGCVPAVTDILASELLAMGKEVDRGVCEHFSHTRQELYDIVRTTQIKAFDQLIERHGTGTGCEVCKPTVASIFATTWNDYVLADQHSGLQDTNDYFLANMQRDGSYSIVPRVPGGEITPDKLMVIAQVAKKFDLYTKITGAQRIDLFGAQAHELPLIWGELVDAGFESGHAYGKALRTVKSCVGTTWCQYGVQDSVGSAIRLEERYRGLRAPHKLKMAVSGCTRECAEAQSKDVGVIATDKGYNLFVGGNGGRQPRHADLFATDLSEKELIKIIDRFLMFYIRTADKLQRTARWIENMPGGLEYVRSVVIDDVLNIGTELEEQMQGLVDTYVCEWKRSLESPERMARFRTFINEDVADQSLEYVRERGQRRPAYPHERKSALKVLEGV